MLIKEFCKDATGITFVIRSDSYGSKLSRFNSFYAEASKDFPKLSLHDVEVVKYAGQHYARTFGIEFHIAGAYMSDVPADYTEISMLEFTS